MAYEPAKDKWDVDALLQFNEPLEIEDPRYVHTEAGRGEFSLNGLLTDLGVDPLNLTLRTPQQKRYLIFCGHRGCGKSTELRKLSAKLNQSNLFFVVFIDVTKDLDPNNLEYSDVLMALAKELFNRLQQKAITVHKTFLSNLESWFNERIEKHEQTKDFASEIKAGLQAEAGIPLLAKIFGSITDSFKINSTYKEELRKTIKNGFSQLAEAFNLLIKAAEEEIKKKNEGQKILFIIDGTDRLWGEGSKRFFIDDSYQLIEIESNFIYCAPISLLYEGNQIQQIFYHHILPMVKITEKNSDEPYDNGYKVLREMVYKRADHSLFDSEDTLNYLIQFSGGSPRELLKLLHYTFQRAEGDKFDKKAAEKAVQKLSTDYRRMLLPQDYKILYQCDTQENCEENPERFRDLLYNLALLEYNEFWRKSHPVVRTLEGYKKLSA